MVDIAQVAFGFQDGIDLYQALAEKIPLVFIINRFFPQGVLIVFVFQRNRKSVVQQVVVAHGQFDFPALVLEKRAQFPGNGKHGFAARRFVAFRLVGLVIVFGQVHGR